MPVGQNNAINNFQQQQQPNQGLNFDANAQQQLVQQQQLQQQQQQQQLMQGAGFGQQGGVANMNIGVSAGIFIRDSRVSLPMWT